MDTKTPRESISVRDLEQGIAAAKQLFGSGVVSTSNVVSGSTPALRPVYKNGAPIGKVIPNYGMITARSKNANISTFRSTIWA